MKSLISFSIAKKHFFLIVEGLRIKTLPAVLVPIFMSVAWAFYQTGEFVFGVFCFTLISGAFIQISANFFNDALDSRYGVDSDLRKGPERLVQSGKMSFSKTQALGFLSCFLAFVFGIPLILRGGWPIFFIGLFSLVLTYFYTGNSFSLLKAGLSELFCVVFFGFATVFGSYFLQTLSWDFHLIYLSLQCGFWSLCILVINYLRDEEEDRKGGRKHIVTVYGRVNSLLFLAVIQALIYLLCFFWLGQGLKSGAWTFFLIPFSIVLFYFVFNTRPSEKYNLYLALCSALYCLFGGVWIAGLLIN